MRRNRFMLKSAAAAVVMTLLFCPAAFAGEWYQDSNGWRYRASSGEDVAALNGTQDFKIDYNGKSYIYCFGQDGYMKTGWVLRDNGWYYYYGDGSQASDVWIDGRYYIDTLGRMETNAVTPDGYYVGGDGAWVPGVQFGDLISRGGYTLTGYQSHYRSTDQQDSRYWGDGHITPMDELYQEDISLDYFDPATFIVSQEGSEIIWQYADGRADATEESGYFTKGANGIYTGTLDGPYKEINIERIVKLPDGRIQIEVPIEGEGGWIQRYFFSL